MVARRKVLSYTTPSGTRVALYARMDREGYRIVNCDGRVHGTFPLCETLADVSRVVHEATWLALDNVVFYKPPEKKAPSTTNATALKFARLQVTAQQTGSRLSYEKGVLDCKYRHYTFANATEKRALGALETAADKAWNKFFLFLESISPRSWLSGPPVWWVRDHLKYEDAVTSGQLSVVPPPSMHYDKSQMETFAAPMQSANRVAAQYEGQ